MDPKNDYEWAVRSINIHGIFFERWCQKTIKDIGTWQVTATNYPVQFAAKESTLDIRAQHRAGDDVISLLIECKKNNPDFVDWIFFPKPTESDSWRHTICVPHILTGGDPIPASVGQKWETKTSLRTFQTSMPVADEAREVRGDYLRYKNNHDKTKTSNTAIADAAHQVALASQFIFLEEAKFGRALASSPRSVPMPRRKHVLFPLIVTTANLFVCRFDPADVDSHTGTIAPENTSLVSVDRIIYEYPLPRHLNSEPSDVAEAVLSNSIELFLRRHIIVVHSAALTQVLSDLSQDEQIQALLG
jgi:hypothetical protein